jgi:short-subunit dehydrogenase
VSNYLEGVRYRFNKLKLPIVVTDVQPGFVDTRMAAGNRFWIASPEKAAGQIAAAIRGRKRRVYITGRWRLVAWLLRVVPDALYSGL